jgi:pyridoxal phosphate enzyme (YggS family)
MSIKNNIKDILSELIGTNTKLIAVSKTQPIEKIQEAYEAGQRLFGENKAQEMTSKYEALPKDIDWHMIGHLQTNKVKYIAPFVALIHSADSFRLLEEINKQARKNNRIIKCLLQVYIAKEETKFGFDESEISQLLSGGEIEKLENVRIIGLMGMATFTKDTNRIKTEFRSLKKVFNKLSVEKLPPNVEMKELSIGMSSDYKIALQEGSTLVRIGTAIFGERNYN